MFQYNFCLRANLLHIVTDMQIFYDNFTSFNNILHPTYKTTTKRNSLFFFKYATSGKGGGGFPCLMFGKSPFYNEHVTE